MFDSHPSSDFGLKWERLVASPTKPLPPRVGTELIHPQLAQTLSRRLGGKERGGKESGGNCTTFTKAEWESMRVKGLKVDHYVESIDGSAYFKPCEAVRGVIFKIHAQSAAPIEWCSVAPEECMSLWPKTMSFRVLRWMPATEANLRCGQPPDAWPRGPFLLEHGHDVQPVLLDTTLSKEELDKSLGVVIIEMEEVLQLSP